MNSVSEFYENSPSIDGFLHTPEMNFFIPLPLMPEIDIHAIGGKQGDYEALCHAVPSKQCVINALQMKSFPKLMSEQRSYSRKKSHNLKLNSACRGLLHEDSRPLTVGVNMVKKYYTFDERLKGSNDIPRKLIECGIVFDASPGDDILVIVAPKKTDEQKSAPLI